MHEYGIARNIVDIALTKANAAAIESLTLEIGGLSGVFDESLVFYLELIFKDLGNERISFTINKIPARFDCACGHTYQAENLLEACPNCGEFSRKITGGRDCLLKSLVVNSEEETHGSEDTN